MITWTVTVNHAAGLSSYDGQAPNAPAARAAAIATARRWARRATPISGYPHYILAVDGQSVAIIATGVDDAGGPAHEQVDRLLADFDGAPMPEALQAAPPTKLYDHAAPAGHCGLPQPPRTH